MSRGEKRAEEGSESERERCMEGGGQKVISISNFVAVVIAEVESR